jgi:hypothetical protein
MSYIGPISTKLSMLTKLTDKKRKILRKVYGALSLTSALFVFQACYGTYRDVGMDVRIQGVVKSKTTGNTIAGIKVSLENHPQYDFTQSNGEFSIYTSRDSVYNLKFEDVDSTQNGKFSTKDTVIRIIDGSTFVNVHLDVK